MKAAFHHGHLREALIETGREVVEAGGAEALSLRDLSRRIGVSATAAYRHFPSREALLRAIAEAGFAELAARFAASAAAGSDPAGRLLGLGLAYVRFATARPALFSLMFGRPPAPGSGPAGEDAYAMLRAALSALPGAPAPGSEALEDAALRLWSLVHGLATLALAGHLSERDDATLARLLAPALQWRG